MTDKDSLPYGPWWDRLSGVLEKYAAGSPVPEPECDSDFEVSMRVVPEDILTPLFRQVLRSPETLPLSELVSAVYEPLTGTSRQYLFNALLEAAPVLRRMRLGVIPPAGALSVESAAAITKQEMARIVEEAQAFTPNLYESITVFFGWFGPMTLGLPMVTKRQMLWVLQGWVRYAVGQEALRQTNERLRSIQQNLTPNHFDRPQQQQQQQQSQVQQSQRYDDDYRQGPRGDVNRLLLKEVTRSVAAQLPAAAASQTDRSSRRPAVQIFHDQDGNRGAEFARGEAMVASVWYQIEVSVSINRRGVPGEVRPLGTLSANEDAELLVTARSDVFEISEPVARIVLPPEGDSSENAQFRIRCRRSSTSGSDWFTAELRLFYKLNLLETFSLNALVNAAGGETALAAVPIVLSQQEQIQLDNLDETTPRALHIYVEAAAQQFRLTFTLKRETDKVALPAVDLLLNSGDLEDRVAAMRKRLYAACCSDILFKQVQGDPDEFQRQIASLAEEGSNIWSLLFDSGGSISEIGRWLKQNPLPDGSAIQVSVDPTAAHFVFAWGLLYDRWSPAMKPAIEGFWGMRYVVEQRPVTVSSWRAGAVPLRQVGAMYWRFAETVTQVQYVESLLSSAAGTRPVLNGPIDTAAGALTCLNACSSELLYFFTHGYTGLPNAERYGFSVQDFIRMYAKLPPEIRNALRYLYEDVEKRQYGADESYIELSSGRLLLNDLYKGIAKFGQHPIVLLNMCDSAQVIPSLSRSFIQFFLSRQARAVLGTECAIRPVFADFAGRCLVKSLLQGVPLGVALLRVRQQAAAQNNPLGLAYTLFGSADACFEPVLPA